MRYLVILVGAMMLANCACAAGPKGAWRQRDIMITFWCPPPATDENLAAVAAQHYTMTWTPADGLDVAARHGLRAMLQDPLLSPASLDNPARRGELDALIGRVKRHPALEAYFITDEPSAKDFSGLGRLVAYLRERDPAHLAYINLFPTYANNQQLGTTGDTVTAYREHLRQYVAKVKPALISYDNYQFFKESDGDQYFLNLEMVREAAVQARVPFLNIIQASALEKVWRLPNANELRFLVYTTLAYGGRGVSYFLYWGPKEYGGLYQEGQPTPLADDAARLNAEISTLSPALMELDSLGVYHTAPLPPGSRAARTDSPVRIEGPGEFVLGLFGGGDRVTSFMIVNRDYRKAGAARVKLPHGVRAIQEFDRRLGRWRAYAAPGPSGAITVELRPGDGRLFRLARLPRDMGETGDR